MSDALAGIRVLDLSRVLAGPWATQLLGDFGADIVKVERPGKGDDTRAWGPPWVGTAQQESAYFLAANRNKRSVCIDLAEAAGSRLVRSLAATADVVIENFRAGTMEKFGLDYPALSEANPRLVYCSISGYGRTSKRSADPGYDAIVQAAGGLMSITGAPDEAGGGPQKVGVAIADIMCGMYAASAILAALRHRDQGGTGQRIEVPLYDSQVAWLANQAMNHLAGGQDPGRLGTAHPNIVPYQCFATRDGHLMLAVGNDEQFRRCVQVLGVAELADDERFATNSKRVVHREALVDTLQQRFADKTTADWLVTLEEAGVPCGPINSLREVFGSDYAHEQGLVRTLPHPHDPELPTVANPIDFSATPVQYSKPPPLLGQHTDAVLQEWLGYSAQEIESLRRSGAIQTMSE